MPNSPNQNTLGWKKKKKALSAVPGRKLAQHSSENLPQRKPAAKSGVEQTFPSTVSETDVCLPAHSDNLL